MDFYWNFLEWVISFKIGLLEIFPFEVFLKGEFVLETEGAVRIFAFLLGLVIKDKEEAGVDVVLNDKKFTS